MSQQQQPAAANNQMQYAYPATVPFNYTYMTMPYYYPTMQADQQQVQDQKTTQTIEDMEKRFNNQLDDIKKHIDEQIQKYKKEQFEAEKRAWQEYGRSRGFI